MALELQERGFALARPLEGGFFGWRDNGLPLVELRVEQRAISNS